MSASPTCASSQVRRRCAGVSALCIATTRRDGNRCITRSSSCGVRLISGTISSTCRPRASARSAARRYTSVLPLPVTPCSSSGTARACDALCSIASTAVACSAVSVGQKRRRRAVCAFGLCGTARALQPLRELSGVEAAQLGRQHAERQLAERTLVVAGGELHQRHPRGAQRRHRVEHLRNRPQRGVGLRRGQRRRRRLPHHAGDLAAPERHAHQRAGHERRVVLVVERLAQRRMARRLDHHLHPRRGQQRCGRKGCVHLQSNISTIAAKLLIEKKFPDLSTCCGQLCGQAAKR